MPTPTRTTVGPRLQRVELAVGNRFNDTPNLISTPASSTADEGGFGKAAQGLRPTAPICIYWTANGDFNTPVSSYGDYGDSFLKVTPDSSTVTDPNINGYGLHVTDYFTPYNQLDLSNADEDLGSGGVMYLSGLSGPYRSNSSPARRG